MAQLIFTSLSANGVTDSRETEIFSYFITHGKDYTVSQLQDIFPSYREKTIAKVCEALANRLYLNKEVEFTTEGEPVNIYSLNEPIVKMLLERNEENIADDLDQQVRRVKTILGLEPKTAGARKVSLAADADHPAGTSGTSTAAPIQQATGNDNVAKKPDNANPVSHCGANNPAPILNTAGATSSAEAPNASKNAQKVTVVPSAPAPIHTPAATTVSSRTDAARLEVQAAGPISNAGENIKAERQAVTILTPKETSPAPIKRPAVPDQAAPVPADKAGRFTPPTMEEATQAAADYIEAQWRNFPQLIGLQPFVCATEFIGFYESKGWMVANRKMKSWREALYRAMREPWSCMTKNKTFTPVDRMRAAQANADELAKQTAWMGASGGEAQRPIIEGTVAPEQPVKKIPSSPEERDRMNIERDHRDIKAWLELHKNDSTRQRYHTFNPNRHPMDYRGDFHDVATDDPDFLNYAGWGSMLEKEKFDPRDPEQLLMGKSRILYAREQFYKECVRKHQEQAAAGLNK